MTDRGQRDEIHQHSGWVIPLGFAAAILMLSGIFLGWYLRPGLRTPAPTPKADMVRLTVRGSDFAIPANYIESQAARAGGAQDSLALAALFPSWRGYSDGDARAFQGNAPDSPVIRLTLRRDANSLDGRARLERIYKPYLTDTKGGAGPFGLTQYVFRAGTGYEQNDLFAGDSGQGLMLFLCERTAPQLASPSCFAVDRTLKGDLGFSYRFKRAYLSRWREIAAGTVALVRRFAVKS